MRIATVLIAAAGAVSLAGCATTPRAGPTEVTRFHNNAPRPGVAVTVQPMPDTGTTLSPEYQLYADAVAAELARAGFPTAAAGAPIVAAVAFRRMPRGEVRTPPRFSVGLGGGSFGGGRRGGVGLGGGVGTGFGGRSFNVTGTELFVQLKQRDGTVVWEGRAARDDIQSQPAATAQRLAAALFQNFPGESGISTSVR